MKNENLSFLEMMKEAGIMGIIFTIFGLSLVGIGFLIYIFYLLLFEILPGWVGISVCSLFMLGWITGIILNLK